MADKKDAAKVTKTNTPIPADIQQEMENARKDRAAQAEYEAGEKARKENMGAPFFKKKGGVINSSASKRGDGIAQRGKTKGRMV